MSNNEIIYKSTKKYTTILIIVSVSLLIFSLLSPFYIFRNNDGFGFITSIVIFLIFISNKFYYQISIKDSQLTLNYYQWLFKKSKVYFLDKVSVKVIREVAFRGGETVFLQISDSNKILEKVSSKDGFAEETFNLIIDYL